MRIISGKLKGKTIDYLKNLTTRPLKNAVRENIFNILNHSNLININLNNSNILDLYSGIGSFGLECISRGAPKVTFVEQNQEAAYILKKNINNLSISNQTNIINDKIENFLQSTCDENFNIFFLDPPFVDKNFIQNLFLIKRKKFFRKKHIIIIHREKNTEDDLKKTIDIILIKQYGRSKIIFGVFN